MDVNSNLLRLKLDMVYRDLSIEEAQKRYTEVTQVPEEKPVEEMKVVQGPPKAKPKRKVVKGLVPKNK